MTMTMTMTIQGSWVLLPSSSSSWEKGDFELASLVCKRERKRYWM